MEKKSRGSAYVYPLLAFCSFIAVVIAALLLGEPKGQMTIGQWDNGIGERTTTDSKPLTTHLNRLPLSFEANRGQFADPVKFLARGQGYAFFLTQEGAVISLKAGDEKKNGRRRENEKNQPAATSDQHRASDHSRHDVVVRMKLAGSTPSPEISGEEKLPGISNYFRGNDPENWHTKVAHYGKVRYREVYPGIDVVYYGNGRQLEYDFVVAAGTDPNAIRIAFEGAEKMEIDDAGNLIIHTEGGRLVQQAPIVYQEEAGEKQPVDGRYVLTEEELVGFQIASSYDRSKLLVIDPVLDYSSFLGGNGFEEAFAITVDDQGFAYVVGKTSSPNFPTAGTPFQSDSNSPSGLPDGFVSKVNQAGSALVFSTFLGGNGVDTCTGVAVGPLGKVHVIGQTFSANFPTTSGVIQTTLNGPSDCFITKLNPDGSSLFFSTLLGGSLDDGGKNGSDPEENDIAVDPEGRIYITGATGSSDFFPSTPNGFQPTFGGDSAFGDAFMALMNSTGTTLLYSTFLGGSVEDAAAGIALDNDRNAYIAGKTGSVDFPVTQGAFQTQLSNGQGDQLADGFVCKINPFASGTQSLIYSTFLGGSASDACDDIAVDSSGGAHVCGFTTSSDFPTTTDAFDTTFNGGQTDAFVTKLNEDGSQAVFSTFLGGANGKDEARGIAVDSNDNVYVTGETESNDFPIETPILENGNQLRGSSDAFAIRFDNEGRFLVFSTYIGGIGNDRGTGIAIDAPGNAFICGDTFADSGSGGTIPPDFPIASFQEEFGGGGNDCFVTKFARPELFAATPRRALTTGGRTITLVGQNLDLIETLLIGGTQVNFTVVDAKRVRFTTPAKSAGFVQIAATFQNDNLILEEDGLLYADPVTRSRAFTGGSDQSSFTMLGLPIAQGSGSKIRNQVKSQINFADPTVARIFRFNGTAYEEGDNITFDGTNGDVQEGMGFWIITANNVTVSVTGGNTNQTDETVQLEDGQTITVPQEPGIVTFLNKGWNQISPSVAGVTFPLESAFVSDSINVFQVVDTDNPFTDRQFFEFTGNIANPYAVATELDGDDAYWIFSFSNETLLFAFLNPAPDEFSDRGPASSTVLPPLVNTTNLGSVAIAAGALAPPPPPAAISNPSSSEGGSGGGGCFIATAAYGTPIDGRIDSLRDFRDESLAPTAIGRAFTETYYANSPATATTLRRSKTARALARRLLKPLVRSAEKDDD